jgi:hypothetical protein
VGQDRRHAVLVVRRRGGLAEDLDFALRRDLDSDPFLAQRDGNGDPPVGREDAGGAKEYSGRRSHRAGGVLAFEESALLGRQIGTVGDDEDGMGTGRPAGGEEGEELVELPPYPGSGRLARFASRVGASTRRGSGPATATSMEPARVSSRARFASASAE